MLKKIVPERNLWITAAVVVVLSLLISALLPAQDEGGWKNLTENLTNTVPEYDASIPGARGVGGLVVDRHTGDVLACLNGPPYGLWKSSDAGQTWSRLDNGEIAGGWVRSAASQLDQNAPGRMAFFRVGPPAPVDENGKQQPSSALTLDGGKTWRVLDDGQKAFDLSGWIHGAVDWSADDPQNLLGQIRVRPSIFLSTDGGENMDHRLGIEVQELTWNHEFMIQEDGKNWESFREKNVKGYGICGDAILLGRWDTGIDRSTDEGGTYEKVADFTVSTITPVFFEGKLYWGAEAGLIVSEDCGKTWNLQGAPLEEIVKGPYFGADASSMMVVTPEGVFLTGDAGGTWNKVSDLVKMPEAWRADADPLWLRQDYAWDHTRNLLYAAGMAGPIYQKQLP